MRSLLKSERNVISIGRLGVSIVFIRQNESFDSPRTPSVTYHTQSTVSIHLHQTTNLAATHLQRNLWNIPHLLLLPRRHRIPSLVLEQIQHNRC